ncbi:MAG: TetR/AcrR family transcriptional regulator [Candidatus Gastranaerophilales bacterium]|nr:TetR/AcrR family transcriptional regulator [Candidatus Gastranaerophilales bacterium]
MAQILKENIKEKIIENTRQALLDGDYLSFNLRDIAKSTDISLSNIYNYFPSKEALLEGVLEDLLADFDKASTKIQKTLKNKKKLLYLNFDKSRTHARTIMSFILKHKTALYILGHKVKGSKLDTFLDEWAQNYAKLEYQSLKLKAKEHKDLMKNLPSEFFVENLCGFFFTSVKKLVAQDLDEKSLKKYLEEIFAFIYQGWDYYAEF